MTLKESLMQVLLENDFNKAAIKLVEIGTGQTSFEVAEMVAQGVINEHSENTNLIELQQFSIQLLFSQLGYVPA